jgi:hypothetical protein
MDDFEFRTYQKYGDDIYHFTLEFAMFKITLRCFRLSTFL